MKRHFLITAEIIALLCLLLGYAGCNGGGSSVGSGSGSTVMTGYFVDGPVQGLRFSTVSQSGYTGANGSFQYIQGELVRFYVGSILLGQARGASEITPFDLAGIAPPQTSPEIVRTRNQIKASNTATPFEMAVNIAIFLQSLDSDGVFANGTQIPSQMNTLATGISIDFAQDSWNFREDFEFRKLIAAGRNAGLWGGTRAIQSPLYAVDTLYQGLGITPDIYIPSLYAGDSGGNGTIDWREFYTYDTSGNLTMYEYDSNADGTMDEGGIYSYDTNGNETMWEWDSDGNGTVDERETYTYDANGNETLYEVDSNVDGTADWRETYTYDANGSQTKSETDFDADGTVDWRNTYTYDASGNQTLMEYDSNADGTVDSQTAYIYNTNGNLTLVEEDSNLDGTVDYRETYAYDANRNLTGYGEDTNGDGTVDYREIYTYDANRNLTGYGEDFDGNGTVDYREAYTYDANKQSDPV